MVVHVARIVALAKRIVVQGAPMIAHADRAVALAKQTMKTVVRMMAHDALGSGTVNPIAEHAARAVNRDDQMKLQGNPAMIKADPADVQGDQGPKNKKQKPEPASGMLIG